jgi:hypothetical protein
MPALRKYSPSVAPVLIVGMTGTPGHMDSVTCSIAPSISGVSGDGGDGFAVFSRLILT